MAYRPPSNKTRGEYNIFNTDKKKPRTPSPPPGPPSLEEAFPTLGNNSQTVETIGMNYASSLLKPQPKAEVIKEVPDGWIHLYKSRDPQLGAVSDRYCDFNAWLEEREDNKREQIWESMLNRYEEYEERNLFQNGPVHMESWQIEPYLKQQELERLRQVREELGSSEESSEDEYVDNPH